MALRLLNFPAVLRILPDSCGRSRNPSQVEVRTFGGILSMICW